MTTTHPNTHPSRRRSWLIVAVLLSATGLAGMASRGGVDPMLPPTPSARVATSADGAVQLRATADRSAVLQGGDGLVRVELQIRGESRTGAGATSLPTDLVVVIDRSGSMQGEKIHTARAAIHQLLSQLGPEDRFGLVAFSSDAHVAIPLSHPTPEGSTVMSATVDALRAGGGTFMSPALDLGLGMIESARVAGRAPRMILISDGLASEGHDVLRAQALRAASGEFALSAIGVGADFDESLMSSLADAGTGNYYYLDDLRELAGIFRAEFETARETIATGLAVSLTPPAGVSVVDAAGYPLERSAGTVTFRPGSLFAGQERRVWVTLRVPTDAAGNLALGAVTLDYADPNGERSRVALPDLPEVACVEQEKDFHAGLDSESWGRSVAVEEYGRLQQDVADYMNVGSRDEAVREIQAFRARNSLLNAALPAPSGAVSLTLGLAAELEDQMVHDYDDADAVEKKMMLKSLGYGAVDGRRVGARK